MSAEHAGPIIPIGGEVGNGLLAYVARASNLKSPRIVAFTCASEEPLPKGERYKRRFARLGFRNYAAVHARSTAEADDPESIEHVECADVLLLLGGCQKRFKQAVAGTRLWDAAIKRQAEGAVLAGTSAGAAVLAQKMPTGGKASEALIFGNIPIEDGFACIPGASIDMHLNRIEEKGKEEGRLPRLFALYAHFPTHIPIGLDENTAAVVQHGVLEVVGAGRVVIIPNCDRDLTNGHSLKKGDKIDPAWFKPDYLAHGDRYDLLKRTRIPSPN